MLTLVHRVRKTQNIAGAYGGVHNAALADASVCLHGNWSTPPSSACRAKSHRRSVKAVAI